MGRTTVQALGAMFIALANVLSGCGEDPVPAAPAMDGGSDANSRFDACVPRPVFRDADGDGYGVPDVSQEACTLPPGFADNAEDCNDDCETCFPRADERCDGVDNDCDGTIDEEVSSTFHADVDGDGYGDPDVTRAACNKPDGFVFDASDCDDGCSACFSGAPELCDTLDNDCDGSIDEGFTRLHADCDGDFYAPASPEIWDDCTPPVAGPSACPSGSWTTRLPAAGVDCNDADAAVHPGNQSWHDSAISGSSGNYDWNCDGVEEPGYSNVTLACLLSGTSCFGYWTAGAVVACGDSAPYQECESTILDGGLACVRIGTPADRGQVCR